MDESDLDVYTYRLATQSGRDLIRQLEALAISWENHLHGIGLLGQDLALDELDRLWWNDSDFGGEDFALMNLTFDVLDSGS